MLTNKLRIVGAALLGLLFMAGSVRAQVLDKAAFEGRVFTEDDRTVPYALTITYAPEKEGSDETSRRIASITLTIDGKEVSIPSAAYADLSKVHRPESLYTDGLDMRRARFEIEGGDGESAYTVVFVVTRERLVQRELQHSEEEPKITRYDEKTK